MLRLSVDSGLRPRLFVILFGGRGLITVNELRNLLVLLREDGKGLKLLWILGRIFEMLLGAVINVVWLLANHLQIVFVVIRSYLFL